MSDFSTSQETDSVVAACDPSIIPIFPVRFALTAETLKQLTVSSIALNTPTSMDSSAQHELTRIRKGYVYVFDGRVFQIFHFNTQLNDDNGSLARSDTPTAGNAQQYRFKKYKWDDVGSEAEWTLLNESYPYVFVPKDTPKAWVAYTEARWPYRFFYQAEIDPAFRNEIMTEVDLTARSGDFCAPLTELADRVSAFRGGANDYSETQLDLTNALRSTGVRMESPGAIVNCPTEREKGVLVALTDPVGEAYDLLGLKSIIAQTKINFTQEHQYPVIIGQGVKNYIEAGDVSIEEGFGWFDEVSSEFDREMKKIEDNSKYLDTVTKALIAVWFRSFAKQEKGSLGHFFTQCQTIADKFSLTAHPKDHSETISYTLFMLARLTRAEAMSKEFVDATSSLFTTLPPINKPNGWNEALATFNSVLNGTKNAIAVASTAHELLKPALNAFFSVYAQQIVKGHASAGANSSKAITALIFRTQVSARNQDELRQMFGKMIAGEGYGSSSLSGQVQDLGTTISGSTRLTPAADGKINTIEFHAQIDLSVTPEQKRAARISGNFELANSGLGVVAAALSMYQTIQGYNGPNRNVSDLGKFGQNPTVQIIAAFSDAADAALNVAKYAVGRSNGKGSVAVLNNIFRGQTALTASAAANGSGGATASIASRSVQVAGKVFAFVGIAMSLFQVAEGIGREDYARVAGNALMAVGSIALLIVSGPLALVAVAAIALGFIITLFQDSDQETWAKLGFWGNSRNYWGRTRPGTVAPLISAARVLSNPHHADYSSIKTYYEDELAAYLDLNAQLEVADTTTGDGLFDVRCITLQSAADLTRLTVEVELIDEIRMWPDSKKAVPGVTKELFSPGHVRIRVPAGNYDSKYEKIKLTAKLQRIPQGGEFKEDISVSRWSFW